MTNRDMMHLQQLDTVLPDEIEKRSFEIIEAELGRELPEDTKSVIIRAIHTSADFDYADNLVFSERAVERALEVIKQGGIIVTDTNMALAGINKTAMKNLGLQGYCLVADAEVAEKAKREGTTRSAAAVDVAIERYGDRMIFVCGNAPTALLRLRELVLEGRVKPSLVVGVPVGFVNVVQSKEWTIALGEREGFPYIVARGRKGGSNIAASIVNALMYKLTR